MTLHSMQIDLWWISFAIVGTLNGRRGMTKWLDSEEGYKYSISESLTSSSFCNKRKNLLLHLWPGKNVYKKCNISLFHVSIIIQ